MKKNMGMLDKIIRFVIAAVIAYLIFTKVLVGVWAIVLGILGAIFLVSSFGLAWLNRSGSESDLIRAARTQSATENSSEWWSGEEENSGN